MPFLKFQKRENIHGEMLLLVTLLKVTPLHGRFSHFLSCSNDMKSRKAAHIVIHKITSIQAYRKQQ